MFNKSSIRWTRLATKAIVPAILLVLIATQVVEASSCKKVKGKFSLQALAGPECMSAIGVCATGDFSGDLAGTAVFTGTSLIPTVDSPSTGVFFMTGDTLITTNGGTLSIKDAISFSNTGNGEFAEVATIISGAGHTGRFTATGTFIGGNKTGTYSGEVCAP